MFRIGLVALVAGALVLSAARAMAGPIYVFSTSEGIQPSNFATITLTQVNSTTVNVLVDLSDTSLPDPQYGLVNSGGPHTPFAFTLGGTESGLSATFLRPIGDTYAFGAFSLSTADGAATPFGTFGISINSTAENGSSKAYFGDLQFNVTRTSGLSTDDFIANAASMPGISAYFAGDFTNGNGSGFGDTGSQAWRTRTLPSTDIPEPSAIALLGITVIWLGLCARHRQMA